MNDGKPHKLNDVYQGLQMQLDAALRAGRAVPDHPGTKGDVVENNWLSMLQEHLPHRYQAQRAFVIDAQGMQSEQIDVVIYDRQYTPELYNVQGHRVIPAEGVYAVLEVKQELDKANIEYAGAKVASVRKLLRTSTRIKHAGGTHEPVDPAPIVGGILTTEAGWNPAFGEPFVSCLSSLPDENVLDVGCCIAAGSFEIDRSEADVLKINNSTQEVALAFFFLHLLHRLQQIGTVPAINYNTYLESLPG